MEEKLHCIISGGGKPGNAGRSHSAVGAAVDLMNNQKTLISSDDNNVTDYIPLLFSTLAISWLALSGYALFIYLAGHYGISRRAIPCFVAWDIQLILTHLAVTLTRRANRSLAAAKL
jgi:hypothetical protein